MKRLQYVISLTIAAFTVLTGGVLMTGCGSDEDYSLIETASRLATGGSTEPETNPLVESAVSFDHTLDNYTPKKKKYNFYFTYKLVHPWWDAVAMGLEDATDQYMDRGVTINYEYLAPDAVSAEDQIERIRKAADSHRYDVIGIDVADSSLLAPVIDELVDGGQKVMTFSSSDTEPETNCKRIAYVGNTHNRQDGADLAEALCQKLNYKGKVGIIVGDPGAPCHEERLEGAKSVIEKYPDMEIVGIAYDKESADRAQAITESYLSEHADLAGMICCNMVNPVGAARAVTEAGLSGQVTIVGMDHDREGLQFLRDGTIYCLGVQDCCSIGFDTIRIAVKVADGLLPGDGYEELTDEKTTLIYQKDAASMLYKLYGEE